MRNTTVAYVTFSLKINKGLLSLNKSQQKSNQNLHNATPEKILPQGPHSDFPAGNAAPQSVHSQDVDMLSTTSGSSANNRKRKKKSEKLVGQEEEIYGVSGDSEEDSVGMTHDETHRKGCETATLTSKKDGIEGEMTSHHTEDDIDEIESPPLIKSTSPSTNQTHDTAPKLPDIEPDIEPNTTLSPLTPPMHSTPSAELDLFSETILSVSRQQYLREADSTDPIMSGGLGPSDSADAELGGPDFLVYDAVFDTAYDADDDVELRKPELLVYDAAYDADDDDDDDDDDV
ncbi:hypothetical protein EYC80_006410 [Monilinia laxa]|uniref:Uncharacterized protein n=1 Tax=Monilinia laxa TaxID=61186 RepID=A0A5N6JUS5_MONLA|nr:hypothetical protein EYC80_006410 [Monilinia laxa]